MLAVDLGHLLPNNDGRIERGLRVLIDHCEALAAQRAQLGVRQGEEALAAEADVAASDVAGSAQVAHDGESQGALAAAGLSHDPQRLSAANMQRDAAHRTDGVLAGPVPNMEVLDLQHGCPVVMPSIVDCQLIPT